MLGHRDQLGHVQALAGAFADDGGGGVLVAVAGGGGDRQPQPMTGRRNGAVGVRLGAGRSVSGGRLDRQMPAEAAQGLLAAAWASAQVRAPGMTSAGRSDRARATMAWARAR